MHFVHPVLGTEEKLIIYHNILQTLNRDCTENIQNNMLQAGMHSESAKKTKTKTCISSFNLAKKIAFITDSFKEYVKSNY